MDDGVAHLCLRVGVASPAWAQDELAGSTTAKGFEFANLHAGADFKVLPNFGVGPFVSFSFGQYDSTSNSGVVANLNGGGDIPNKAIHEWLTLGVRGAFKL